MDTTHAEIAYVTKQIKAVEMVIKKLELELKTAEESSATGDQTLDSGMILYLRDSIRIQT